MTKSSRKNVPDARIDCGASCFPSDIATYKAIVPGINIICVFPHISMIKVVSPLKIINYEQNEMSRVLRIPAFSICENEGADQLRGNRFFSIVV